MVSAIEGEAFFLLVNGVFLFPLDATVALAAAPDCANDRIVEGEIFDAVDAVVIAVFTNR